MTATSLPAALDNGAGIGGLAASLILVGLGVGGVKAVYFPFLGVTKVFVVSIKS